MKRRAPRPLKTALEAISRTAEPVGTLARVQRLWPEVAGASVAAATEPVSMREGILTVRCESAVWAQELELLGSDIRSRLNAALGADDEVREVRFKLAQGRFGRPDTSDP